MKNNGLFYIFLTAVLFTTLEPVSKLISGTVSPFMMTFIRFFIGGLIIMPFALKKAKKEVLKLSSKDYAIMAVLGILCVCISMPLLQYSVKIGDSPALIAIIFSSNSVFTILLSVIILKDKLTVRKIAGVALCAAGILVCFDFDSGTGLMSAICAVAAAAVFSVYTVVSKKMTAKIPGIVQTGFSFFFGGIALLIVVLVTGEAFSFNIKAGIEQIIILGYLGVCITGIGYWSYFRAMEKSSAIAASLVFFIKPVLTPFAAFVITGTPFTFRTFAALILVVVGSVVISATGKNKDG